MVKAGRSPQRTAERRRASPGKTTGYVGFRVSGFGPGFRLFQARGIEVLGGASPLKESSGVQELRGLGAWRVRGFGDPRVESVEGSRLPVAARAVKCPCLLRAARRVGPESVTLGHPQKAPGSVVDNYLLKSSPAGWEVQGGQLRCSPHVLHSAAAATCTGLKTAPPAPPGGLASNGSETAPRGNRVNQAHGTNSLAAGLFQPNREVLAHDH